MLQTDAPRKNSAPRVVHKARAVGSSQHSQGLGDQDQLVVAVPYVKSLVLGERINAKDFGIRFLLPDGLGHSDR